MATKFYNKEQKRKGIDPKTIRKHSDIVRQATNSTRVSGEREVTKTGYRAGVYLGKTLESFYEYFMEGAYTDLSMHDKKYKVVRVLGGTGYLLTVTNPTELKESWITEEKTLVPGDVVEFEPTKAYRIATGSTDPLEVVVTQEPKYDSRITVIEETDMVANITESMLHSVTRTDIIDDMNYVPPPRGPSKAVQQLQELRGQSGERTERPIVQSSINKNPQADLAAFLASSEDG